MSVQDEHELRARLSTLLDDIEPRPAPVARVVRRGRGIRMRRWVSVAAGLAVVVAGAALIPGFLQAHRVAPIEQLHYKVTVTKLGRSAKGGVIGAGTIGSKRWRVVVNGSQGDGCAPQLYVLTCGFTYNGSVGPRQVSLGSASAGRTQYEVGTVGAAVTRVAIRLSNNTVLSLKPVSAGGRRWVAVAAPLGAITWAVSYVGQSEYERALPFDASGVAQFITWLGPGQPGLPVASRSVGSGEFDGAPWHAAVHTGPWGLCATFANGSACIPASNPSQLSGRLSGRIVAALTCGPLATSSGKATGASSGVAIVSPDIKDVVLQFADGSQLRIAAIAIGGTKVLGYAIPAHLSVVSSVEYGAAGQVVGHTGAATWKCG